VTSGAARTNRTIAAAALAVLLVQAWASDGYYHPDEYFQTVEFASAKLGVTDPAAMAWELGARMRPWLQPAIYFATARGLRAIGVEAPGAALLVFRLLGAVAGWAAMLLLWRALSRRLPDERGRTALLAACGLAWYLPFVLVRTSSESLAASLLAIAVAAFLLLEARSAATAGLAAGVALGLAFDARYQVGFSLVGFAAWLALVRRSARATAACVAGIAAAIAFGLVLDRWGYGAWTATPWNYLRVNLLEGKAVEFGRAPPWFYFVALPLAHAPLSALLLAGVLLFWWRARTDVLTWTTLPFFLGHAALARKEVRFLLPLALLAAAMVALVVLDPRLRPRRLAPDGRLVRWTARLNLVFLAALVLVPIRHELSVQLRARELLDARPATPVIVLGRDPYVDKGLPMPFLRPAAWSPVALGPTAWAEAQADPGFRPGGLVVAFLGNLPPPELRGRLELLASPLPEAVAKVLRRPVRRTDMRALWRVVR
jgi:phosphatidylinositol glycan class B